MKKIYIVLSFIFSLTLSALAQSSGGFGSYPSGSYPFPSSSYPFPSGSGGTGGGTGGCVYGCTNPDSCNYSPTATCDNGSCAGTKGCTNTSYCNYNPAATCNDGSCTGLKGCTNSGSCNYNASATCDDGSCTPFVTPSVRVLYSPDTVCSGITVTFTASVQYGGILPSYQWMKDRNPVGVNSNIYTDNALNSNDSVWVVMTSDTTCATPGPDTSNISYITVDSALTPQVSITPSLANACAGVPITFTASSTYGGTSPTYEWIIDGNYVLVDTSSTYVDSTLNNNDGVWAVMISSLACAQPDSATSNSILMTVNPSTAPTIGITGPGTVCGTGAASYTANATYAGVTPTYQWMVDGAAVGTNSDTFSTTSLNAGDSVACMLTSSANCAVPNTVTSTAVDITAVASDSLPTVSISGSNSVCAGSQAAFNATTTDGGNTPSYQWQVNGNNAGINSSSFSTSSLNNGDVVSCILTSNAPCATPATVTSNSVNMDVIAVPSTPVITQNGSTLTSNAVSGNQWYLNGNLINGATSQTYSPTQDGDYTVIATNDNCSSVASNTIQFYGLGISNVGNSDIKIYPNPANDVLYIQAGKSVITSVDIINMMGQTIAVNTVNSNFYQLRVSNLAQGNYLLLLHTNDGVANKLVSIVRE